MKRQLTATALVAGALLVGQASAAVAGPMNGEVATAPARAIHNASLVLKGFSRTAYVGSQESVSAVVKSGGGRTLELQTKRGTRWQNVTGAKVGKSGKVTLRHVFGLGSHTLRLSVQATRRHKAVTSTSFISSVVPRPLPPPPPPAPPAPPKSDMLGHLTVTSGEFYDTYDSSNGTAEINGVSYPHSLLLNCATRGGYAVTVNTGRSWSSLHTVLGLRDDSASASYGLVEMFGDGKLLFRQQVNFATATPIDLDLSGVVALTVRTTCVGSGNVYVAMGSPTVSTAGSAHPSAHAGPTVTWLTDNSPVSTTGGHDDNYYNRELLYLSGHPLGDALGFNYDTNGKTCNNCESDASASYNLGRSATHLTGFLGLSDNDDTEGTAVITFALDGATLGSYPLKAGTFTPFDLNVTNGLRLTVTISSPNGATFPVIGDTRILTGGDLATTVITATPTYL